MAKKKERPMNPHIGRYVDHNKTPPPSITQEGMMRVRVKGQTLPRMFYTCEECGCQHPDNEVFIRTWLGMKFARRCYECGKTTPHEVKEI